MIRRATIVALLAALASTVPVTADAPADGPDPRVSALAVGDGRLVLARTREISIVEIVDPERPRPLGRVGLTFTPRRVRLEGRRLLAIGDTHGVAVVDVGDPEQPIPLLEHDPYPRIRDAGLLGDHLLLAAHRDGLHVLDASDAEAPRRVARVSTRDELVALDVDGSRVVTAEGQAGVRLFDLSTPRRPREIGRWGRVAAGALDVELVGERIWVAAGRRGVLVLDAGREEKLLHHLPSERAVFALDRDGDRLLAVDARGVSILDVDAPTADARRIDLARGAAVADAAFAGAFVSIGMESGWSLVEPDGPDGARVRWPPARRMRVTFD